MLLRGSYHANQTLNRLLISVTFASLTLGAFFALIYFSTSHVNISSVQAAVPKIISYQAKVTDSSGVTVTDGSYSIKFKLYDASSSGNCLYVASGTCASPTAVTTTITSGVFSVLLGDTSAGFNTLTTSTLASSSVYLGVTIGSDSEMTPRKRLVATPYAMNALSLNGLDPQTDGGTSSYIVAATSTGNIIITGTATSTFTMGATFATSGGTVGIGTSTPQYKLDVYGDISASQGIRDGNAWIGNQAYNDQLARAYNNGGFGGGASPGNLVTTSSDVSVFDTALGNVNSKGFFGAVFDGRYVYFVPNYNNNPDYDGQVTRYDTTQSFTATSSYTFFDTAKVNSNSVGFNGAIFDGRYVYLVPYLNNSDYSGLVTRYDTTQNFSASSSYAVFDITTVNTNAKGFGGGTFDGRYVYFSPDDNGTSGNVARYDTTQNFTTAASWSVYDTAANVNANSKGFLAGTVFDGRYIYFIPYNAYNNGSFSGQITRYDTTGNFTTAASWSFFDTAPINTSSKGFQGGVFDGRYIYMIPFRPTSVLFSGQITRYDTTAPFTATSSYSFFDTGAVNASSTGFIGGVFDGRYLYMVPYGNNNPNGQITKYDTTQSFTASSSYSFYDTTQVSTSSKGFAGGVFDGHYVYLVPNANGQSIGDYQGQITRIRAYTGGINSHPSINQTATTKDLYIASNAAIGIGTDSPSARLTVANGGIDIGSGSATTTVSSTFFMLNKTSTNASGTFFVDQSGNIFASGSLFAPIGNLIPSSDNTSDLGSATMRWRNIYTNTTSLLNTSGTIAIGTLDTTNVTSTFYHGLLVGVKTNYNAGVFNVDTNGNVNTSGTVTSFNAMGSNISSSTGGLAFLAQNLNSGRTGGFRIYQADDGRSSIISSNFAVTDQLSTKTGPTDNFNGTADHTGRGSAYINMSEGGIGFGTLPSQAGGGTITALTRLTISRFGNVDIGMLNTSSSARLTIGFGGLDIGSGSVTTTVSSTFFAFGKTSTKSSGTFYIDSSGNTYSSGTFAFLNTAAASSSIRGLGLVLTDASAGQASSLGFGLVMPGGYICVSASTTKCTVGGGGSYTSGSIYASFYRSTGAADVAENFLSTESLEPGDVVTFDNINSQYIKKTTMANESLIAGVVSTMPGVILGNDGPGTYPLALTGRVPVKVSNENGPIQIGDELVASSKPGIAMKYVASSTTSNVGIIGIALETLPSDQSEGKITIFLRGGMTRPTFHEPTSSLTITTNNTNDLITYNHDIDVLNHSILNVKAIAGAHWSMTEDGLLKVERIETTEIQTNKLSITSNGNDTKTAGRGIIPAGVKAVVVESQNITDNSEIFITWGADPGSAYFVTNKIAGQSFTVELAHEAQQDIPFTYWIVDIHEATETVVQTIDGNNNPPSLPTAPPTENGSSTTSTLSDNTSNNDTTSSTPENIDTGSGESNTTSTLAPDANL